ncbi:phospholipase D family protein [Cognatilysobacter terrigena]|uniref:phospholipase D family protein n=1 Tax=Cognatilysobacter terrigena TaxID=2488749 RepID=UPI001FE75E62|nr:phospholipase D family protein [Lysobacter terrigena]
MLTRLLMAVLLVGLLGGCAGMSSREMRRVDAVVEAGRPTAVDCDRADACARPSPLHELAGRAFAESMPEQPRHYTMLLDRGSDALLARIDLIRTATTSIDLQTYIFDEDDSARFVLDELIKAARRGVRVRILMDQLSALKRVETLAALAGAHANLEARVYNPVLGRARISYPGYALAAACCWHDLNRRMHTKLLLIDGAIGITGGRNYQDDYYDWSSEYNFRDRDVLIAGPAARSMDDSFEGYWNDRRAVPIQHLSDVGHLLVRSGIPALPQGGYEQPARLAAAKALVDDSEFVTSRLMGHVLPVGQVDYVADPPGKVVPGSGLSPASVTLRDLILGAKERVMLQTPYLVLSEPAREMFRTLHQRPDPPRVIVSTNSLAATDAFIAYALSYKYKRRYLREYGFNIYEMKPVPEDVPIDVATTGAVPADVAANNEVTPTMERAVASTPGEATGTHSVQPLSGATAVASGAPRTHATSTGIASPATPTATTTAGATNTSTRIDCDRRSVVDCNLARQNARRAKPRPLETEFAALAYGSRRSNAPVPLERAGVRMGLHAKSVVIDESVGVVGTHNFDPRGDHYNTESMVVVRDPAFARELAASIGRDISPANSWVIAPRDKAPVLSGVDYSVTKASEQLPIFDLWPRRYGTSYAFKPSLQCTHPLYPDDPKFRDCYEPVGDFPEVALGFKSVMTRIFTAFGAGLAPIL